MPNHAPAKHRRWQATLIITLFLFAVVGAAGIGWWYARESPPHQGPIVLISIDGLPAAAFPPDGGQAALMPAIAALAEDAVVFDRAYAHATLTLPVYASMLTGQIPPMHGVRDDAGFALGSHARTLAELLRGRGFATAAVMSSFLLRRETGVAQGFSFFDAELPEPPDDGLPAIERDGSSTIDAAERWMRTQDGQRYFLFVQVPGSAADAAVTRLVQLLKDRDRYESSTMILVGGRGDAGVGASLDDSALRIPLMVKQPDREGAGRRVSVPVQQVDLVPTLLDLVRAPFPSGLRGRSLRPLLDDSDGTIPAQPIYSESLTAHFRFGGTPIFAMTTDRYRFVRGVDESLVQMEAVDEQPAPDETTETARLRASLDRVLGTGDVPPASPVSAADENRFALLGYLNGMRSVTGVSELDQEQQTALVEAHREAVRLVGERKLFAAVGALQAIVRDHPMLAPVHYQIGVLLERSGRLEEAISAFRDAERLQPESTDVSLALASTLLRAGRSNEARDQADLAVERAGSATPRELATAHEIAARAALELRDTDAANRHALSAREAEEDLPLPQFVRGRLLYNEGSYEEAVAAFTEAEQALREQDLSIADLHLYLGEALTHLDRHAEAEAQFREEIREYPRGIQAYASLAMLYRATNRETEIEPVLDDLLDAVPTPEGYAAAARLWTILGDRPRAEAIRSDARTRFRGDPSLALVGRR